MWRQHNDMLCCSFATTDVLLNMELFHGNEPKKYVYIAYTTPNTN